jgi:hypothetical protein
VWEDEYGANTVCMYVNGKWNLLKLFWEWCEIEENGGGGEFKYDIVDIL